MPTKTPSLSSVLGQERELRVAREQQNILLGFLAGFMATIAGTALWVAVALQLGGRAGWCAILVGGGVGISVRFFGRGFDRLFGVLGASCTLLACGGATLLIGSKQLAEHRQLTLWQSLGTFQPHSVSELFAAGFLPRDAIAFVLAAALAWWLARRAAPCAAR